MGAGGFKSGREVFTEIPFTGRLRTADDPSVVGTDFITLQNLRYRPGGLEMIGGMSKINSTAVESGAVIETGHHFRKEQPAESHVLVESNAKILKNDTAIPGTGDFNGTALYTLTSGADTGDFSDAPDGHVMFANGEEVLYWGGDENRCASFIVKNPLDDSQNYDFTDAVTDTRDSSPYLATVYAFEDAIDSDVKLLLHLDNNVTDATGNHTPTDNGVTFDASTKKFGTHAAKFPNTITVADHADFDFSGGTFTIDAWIYLDSGISADFGIYQHQTDANNTFDFFWNYADGTSDTLDFNIKSGGSSVVQLNGNMGLDVYAGAWHHVAVVESGDNWYLFINGFLVDSLVDTDRAANYTGSVTIGYSGGTSNYIDELRVSNGSARYTSSFTPRSSAYGTNYLSYLFVGSVKPLDGVKFTVETANAETSTMVAQFWNGSGWQDVSNPSDGTASGGITLAKTGSFTFDSTVSTAKIVAVDRLLLYWYRFEIATSATPTDFGKIEYVTLEAPMQEVKDLWDGDHRVPITSMKFQGGTLNDFTVNVSEESYDTGNDATFMNMGASGFGTSNYLYLGFVEPMMGINMNIIGDAPNTNVSSMIVQYWNGSAWTNVTGLADQTSESGKTMNKSGYVTWTPIAEGTEFKRMDVGNLGNRKIKETYYEDVAIDNETNDTIRYKRYRWKTVPALNNTGGYPFPVYVYKITFSAALSSNIKVFNIGGIPAPSNVQGYKFPFMHRDRVWLCSHSKRDKHSAVCSATFSSNIFNGDDTIRIYFGGEDALISAASLYTRFTDSINHAALFFKKHETWMLFGDLPENFNPIRISGEIGCIAKDTVAVAEIIPPEGGTPTQVAIWMGANGVYMFSGNVPIPIHYDIRDKFDPKRSGTINRTYISDSYAFYDEQEKEYHLLIPTGESTTLNEEWVFSLEFGKWFQVPRNTALRSGIEVADTSGNEYAYGCDGAGFMYRLEHGTSFDGNAITGTWEFGDIAPDEGRVNTVTKLRYLNHTSVAKTTTTNTLTIEHYGDSSTTGTTISDSSDDLQESGKRLVTQKYSRKDGDYVFHRFKGYISTDDETIGYEPLFLSLEFMVVRRDHNAT